MSRRRLLRGVGALVACGGCAGDSAPAPCVEDPSIGSGTYCLVDGLVVRVARARGLAEGQAVLANVDDSTAVIVARDVDGWYARSAICTHACCVVSLCRGSSCATLTATPDACQTVDTPSAGRVLCPCHGSEFRLSDGVPLNGPATTPLPSYALEIDAEMGDVLVDTGRVVDAAVRST